VVGGGKVPVDQQFRIEGGQRGDAGDAGDKLQIDDGAGVELGLDEVAVQDAAQI
jgi:hypothetical protein